MKSYLSYLTNLLDAVYCINLPKSINRYNRFIKTYKNFPHQNLIIFPAVDGNTIIQNNWPGNAGELGCRQSHINFLKDALIKNFDVFMVVEDDVIFPKKLTRELYHFLRDVGSD